MKTNLFFPKISYLIVAILAAFFCHPVIAQIPQNIEVDGGPARFWDYAVYALVLGGIILAIFLIARIFKKPQK